MLRWGQSGFRWGTDLHARGAQAAASACPDASGSTSTHSSSFTTRTIGHARSDSGTFFKRTALKSAFAAFSCVAFLAPATPALAQDTKPTDLLSNRIAQADPDTPMLIQADELIYDNDNARVTARGNVEIYYNNYTLLADRVLYDRDKSTLEAQGNVRIKEPNGAVVNADRITLTDDFKEGFIKSLRVVTRDDLRIAAANARRTGGNTTEFDRGVYTACKTCQRNGTPLWRVRAKKITHKQDEGNIYYENAAFEFFGVPVAYLPYFVHPDPSVKRRSGFLFPSLGSSEDLGFMATIPYYFALAPNYDLLLSPRIMSKMGILAQGEWRHRLRNGAYNVKFAGIYQQERSGRDTATTRVFEDEFRGSIETQGRFDLSRWWSLGWDATIESDDSFRRFYKLDSVLTTDRVSKAYVEGISPRNYFGLYFYHFGGLLLDDTSTAESIVHPVLDYNYIFANRVLGGELSFDVHALSLSRAGDVDNNHLIAEAKWRRQMVDPLGQVFTPFASLRGDVYKTSDAGPTDPDLTPDNSYLTRGLATAGLNYQYPFVAHTARASHIVAPTAQIIARPSSVNQNDVSNEDAKSLVFDETLLFDTDKFSGYDRVETGVRANVGLQYTLQLHGGGYMRAVFGQSFHLSGENPYSNDVDDNNEFRRAGLENDRSDYVAGLYLQPNNDFQLLAQSRFSEESFALERQDLFVRANFGFGSATLNYAFAKADPDNGILDTAQELLASASLKLSDSWTLFGSIRYDLQDDFIIANSLGLRYACDCFSIAVTYQETNVNSNDVDPDRTLRFQINLKTLGEVDFKSDVIDGLLPDNSDPEKTTTEAAPKS